MSAAQSQEAYQQKRRCLECELWGFIQDSFESPRITRILMCRFGIGCDPMTFEETARVVPHDNGSGQTVSRERCRQLEKRAIGRLERIHPGIIERLLVPLTDGRMSGQRRRTLRAFAKQIEGQR